MKKICGIYKITCIPNDKIYIGQSMNINERWKEHKRSLKASKHINKRLQEDWNKYGEGSLKFEIIKECEPTMLNRTESRLIQKYDAFNTEIGYNTSKLLVYDLSDEEIEKLKNHLLKIFDKNEFGKYLLNKISEVTKISIHNLQIVFSCITSNDLEPYDFGIDYNCENIYCNVDKVIVEKFNKEERQDKINESVKKMSFKDL